MFFHHRNKLCIAKLNVHVVRIWNCCSRYRPNCSKRLEAGKTSRNWCIWPGTVNIDSTKSLSFCQSYTIVGVIYHCNIISNNMT